MTARTETADKPVSWDTKTITQVALIVIGLVGQTVWVGQRFGATERQEQSNTHRLDVIETVGSPSLGVVRVTQEESQRRIEQLQTALEEAGRQIASDRERIGVLDAQVKFLADAVRSRR